MILLCPNCNTRYRVDDAALADPAGRELRCANCGHRWRYVPEAGERPAEAAPPAAPVSAKSPNPPASPAAVPLVASRTPETASSPAPAPAALPRPVPQRGSHTGLGCLLLLVILAVAVAVGVLARDRIVGLWHPAASFYRAVGLKLEPLGAGLEIAKVAPSRNGDVLVVEGEVTNTTDSDRAVPRLRVILRDTAGKELASKIIDPPTPNLARGATAHFKTQFDRPSDAATRVDVTFMSGN